MDTITRLTIQGDDILKFINDVKGETNLDFNKVLPVPFELKYTIFPVKILSEKKYKEAWHKWISNKKMNRLSGVENKLPRIGMTASYYDYLMEKYSYSNWFEWCIGNYSTSSTPYDVTEWYIDMDKASIYYTTINAATNFYITISKNYPNLTFKHVYYDGECIEDETFVCGQLVDSNDYPSYSNKYKLLKHSFDDYIKL